MQTNFIQHSSPEMTPDEGVFFNPEFPQPCLPGIEINPISDMDLRFQEMIKTSRYAGQTALKRSETVTYTQMRWLPDADWKFCQTLETDKVELGNWELYNLAMDHRNDAIELLSIPEKELSQDQQLDLYFASNKYVFSLRKLVEQASELYLPQGIYTMGQNVYANLPRLHADQIPERFSAKQFLYVVNEKEELQQFTGLVRKKQATFEQWLDLGSDIDSAIKLNQLKKETRQL